jgi:hypothetical protein
VKGGNMEFTKKDLRNNVNPLLRRVQRQVDIQNEQINFENVLISNRNREKKENIHKKGYSLLNNGFDDNEYEKPLKLQTRLGLLKQREGR